MAESSTLRGYPRHHFLMFFGWAIRRGAGF